MADAIEQVDGKDAFAFTGDRRQIWHRKGQEVAKDMTPEEFIVHAGANWRVDKIPLIANVPLTNGKTIAVDSGKVGLIRSTDQKVLDVVSPSWNPVQNIDAFKFFNEFVAAGDMDMDTGGVLNGGRVVFANAKIKESFNLFGGDEVEAYLLFMNPHQFGQSITIKTVATRTVCANTLAVAMGEQSKHMFRQTHRIEFDADAAKLAVGIAANRLETYKTQAQFLGTHKAADEDVVEFFKRLFPVHNYKGEDHVPTKDVSKNAGICMGLLDTQPGAEFAQGSWWTAFNAVTRAVDHEIGKDWDKRTLSSLNGKGAETKIKALHMAMDYADKSKGMRVKQSA